MGMRRVRRADEKGYTKVRWYIGFLLGIDQKKKGSKKKKEDEKEAERIGRADGVRQGGRQIGR